MAKLLFPNSGHGGWVVIKVLIEILLSPVLISGSVFLSHRGWTNSSRVAKLVVWDVEDQNKIRAPSDPRRHSSEGTGDPDSGCLVLLAGRRGSAAC